MAMFSVPLVSFKGNLIIVHYWIIRITAFTSAYLEHFYITSYCDSLAFTGNQRISSKLFFSDFLSDFSAQIQLHSTERDQDTQDLLATHTCVFIPLL